MKCAGQTDASTQAGRPAEAHRSPHRRGCRRASGLSLAHAGTEPSGIDTALRVTLSKKSLLRDGAFCKGEALRIMLFETALFKKCSLHLCIALRRFELYTDVLF